MQNRYVGDIGDFGKYGLLRALVGLGEASTPSDPICLGVVWYLYRDESHNSDGKHTGYLRCTPANHARFRTCDPGLYDALRRLVATNNRHITGVRESGILPADTAYFERCLDYAGRASRRWRQEARTNWMDGALQATVEADVIFVDPDNGISETEGALRKGGPKYVFMEDLGRFYGRGQSLVIYHHLGRRGPAVQQIKHFAKSLQSNPKLPRLPWSLWYHRGTARAYFVAAQERHESVLKNRLASFLDVPWRTHFELVE